MSTSSRLSLTMDWMKAVFSGRDVVEPVLKRRPTIAESVESFGTSLRRNPTIALVQERAEEATQKKRFWIL